MAVVQFISVGYAALLAAAFALLWTFGRERTTPDEIVEVCVALCFPAVLGAALVRLVL